MEGEGKSRRNGGESGEGSGKNQLDKRIQRKDQGKKTRSGGNAQQ